MPSQSLQYWTRVRARELDEIEAAHRAVGGVKPGRRYATKQVNHAYATLVASHFQGFCRDLHSEAVQHLVAAVSPAVLQSIVRRRLLEGRKLDGGNANPGNIGSDFARLGLDFWPAAKNAEPQTDARKKRLEQLNGWRNAIAHQDFDTDELSPPTLRLSTVRSWRRTCGMLAVTFDDVLRAHVAAVVGKVPW